MFHVMLYSQWKWTRLIVALGSIAAFALPIVSVQGAARADASPLQAGELLQAVQSWGTLYPVLAAALGLLVAIATWAPDHRGRHEYRSRSVRQAASRDSQLARAARDLHGPLDADRCVAGAGRSRSLPLRSGRSRRRTYPGCKPARTVCSASGAAPAPWRTWWTASTTRGRPGERTRSASARCGSSRTRPRRGCGKPPPAPGR